jgi:uncharacterized membrane protein
LNSRTCSVLGLILMIIGASLFFSYLLEVESNVPFFVLVTAVLIMASSTVLSFAGIRDDSRRNVAYFLVTISILYFSISMISTIRYQAFSGLGSPDNLGEYFVAQVTYLKKAWTSNYGISLAWRPSWYFSCLSVTIFPTILAELTGIGLSSVFAMMYPIIFSIIPTLVFLVIKEVYSRTEIAALSTILFCDMFRFSAPQMGREYIAIIFLLLTLLVVFRQRLVSTGKKHFVLFLLFVLGVVLSHYLVSYFMIAILIGMILAPHLRIGPATPARINFVNRYTVVLALVASTSWIVFSNMAFFVDNILVIKNSFSAILGIAEAQWPSEVSTPGRTAGGLVTSWYALQSVLMIVGLCLILLKERKKSQRIFTWTIAGGLLFIVLFLSFVTPVFAKFLGFNRVYSIALPIWISFLAYVLLKTNKRFGSVLLVIFLIMNLPINLTLPSYNNQVIYTPERNVSPALAYLQTFNDKSEVATFEWAQNWLLPNQTVSVDARGMNTIQLTPSIAPQNVVAPEYGDNSSFLVLNHYNLQYSLWTSMNGIFEAAGIQDIVKNSSVIYNNQQSMLLEKPQMP